MKTKVKKVSKPKPVVFKVGQIIRNKRNGFVRRVTKVSKNDVFWVSKDGKKKGSCSKYTLASWVVGNDHRE